eukprot:TRINITY_DN71310_c0_g1_i1.p1 TRINITY_DN71310_c0_g1~~TRINITY_DN71310_c0_g1_i1.p1  ORF type:complete len:185 (-),score=43.79 TRINITY_DN71310_c0_g1_i1:64-618(-)
MVQWYWKSDLRTGDGSDWAWSKYAAKDNKKIEDAFQAKKKTLVLSAKYHIDFGNMIQHRADDYDRQRDIKRVAADGSDSDSDSDPAPKKKKAKKGALTDCAIALSGTLSQTHAQWGKEIEDNDGTYCKTVSNACTHLVTTPHEVSITTEKVLDARKKGAKIVSEKWLSKSIKLGASQPAGPYAL